MWKWLLVLAACGHSSSVSMTSFDGVAVGGSFAAVQKRVPYDNPCDDDPLEREKSIRAMIYAGGRPCHHAQFPDGTSVVILVEGDKIAAWGWMGGTYFDKRSGLPLVLGEPFDKAVTTWGKPAATFDLRTMHVARFGNGLRVLSGSQNQIVGYAIGDLPDASSPRWEEFDHMYSAYTLPVGVASMSVDECKTVMQHIYELEGATDPKISDVDLADCRSHNTPEMNKCILAATTKDALHACFN